MVEVIIELRGLIDLVSDRTGGAQKTTILFPNATDPNAAWIPDLLKFNMKHEPRLMIRKGQLQSNCIKLENLSRCGDNGIEKIRGVRLNGRHVTLETDLGRHQPDRGTPGNPNQGGSATSLKHGPDMEDLMDLAVPPAGPISSSLLAPDYGSPEPRIIARMEVGTGRLQGRLWKKQTGGYPKIRFIQKSSNPCYYDEYKDYLVETYQLSGSIRNGSTLKVKLRKLADSADQEPCMIEVLPTNQAGRERIHLLIENGPQHCHGGGEHFLAHYLLRDNWEDLEAVRIPDISYWVAEGAGNNPQCSPGDNNG